MDNYTYGFTKFAFNDDFQELKPLFIKIYYRMFNLTLKTNNVVQKNKFAFGLTVELLDNNNNSFISFHTPNVYYNTNWDYQNEQSFFKWEIKENSVGFKNNNSLFVNIYPHRNVAVATTHRSNNYPPENKSNYISFYIERNENIIKIINLSGEIGIGYAQKPVSVATNITYIPYDKNYRYSSNNGVYFPFSDRKINNISNITSYTYDIDPLTNKLYKNDNVLIAYTSMVSDSVVEVKGQDNITNEYYVHKPEPNNCLRYITSTNISLLFRV